MIRWIGVALLVSLKNDREALRRTCFPVGSAREQAHHFCRRNRTPGASPLVNSTPSVSSAARMSARCGGRGTGRRARKMPMANIAATKPPAEERTISRARLVMAVQVAVVDCVSGRKLRLRL